MANPDPLSPLNRPTESTEPAAPQAVIVQQHASEPGCFVQALWFIFVGWWAGAIATSVAWGLNVTIIGLPIGLIILNNIPRIVALQNPAHRLRVAQVGDLTHVIETEQEQYPVLLRAAYFLLIGWWWSGVWMSIAYVLCGLLITMPLGLAMFRRTPLMTTLRRY